MNHRHPRHAHRFSIRRSRHFGFVLAAVFTLALSAVASRALAQQPSTILVGRYVAPDGTLKPSANIELRDGKFASIKMTDEPATGAYAHAVVCPGLIDLRSNIGSYGQTNESKNAIDPSVNAIDGIDWHHRDFKTALSAGVTAAMISPSPHNLVSGVAAVIKTDPSRAVVLRADGPLVLSLGPQVWRYDRSPTSRTGSLAMLRDLFDTARRGQAHPRLNAMVKGGLTSLVYCDDAMDVSAVLRLFDTVAGPDAIVHTGGEHDLANELSGRATTVVVGPYGLDTPPRELALAGTLSNKEVPVAFAGQVPVRGRDSVRLTAALAVRYGMAPEAARRGMTITAAKVAGVVDRIGSIETGKDADFVIFSDDPLRLDAKVLAVYIGGTRVYADHAALRAAGDVD